MDNAGAENWRVLTTLFPAGWDRKARESGAISRQRGITVPETLLRLFLLHVARGYSLAETSVLAKQAGLAQISNVGLMKRLCRWRRAMGPLWQRHIGPRRHETMAPNVSAG